MTSLNQFSQIGTATVGRSQAVALRPAPPAKLRLRGQVNHPMPAAHIGPRAMIRLLTAALEHGIEVEYAQKVLRAYDTAPAPEALLLIHRPWPIRIRTLGRLEIEVDGAPITFGRKTPTVPLALLQLLAASAEPITTERLTTALWPGYGEGAPRGSLDTAVYRLRKLLGVESAVQLAGGCIGLSERLCWTDVRALSVLADQIAVAAGERQTPETLERWEHSLFDLYRAPFAVDDQRAPFARARNRLLRRFTRATEDLGRLWADLGRSERYEFLAHHAHECEAAAGTGNVWGSPGEK